MWGRERQHPSYGTALLAGCDLDVIRLAVRGCDRQRRLSSSDNFSATIELGITVITRLRDFQNGVVIGRDLGHVFRCDIQGCAYSHGFAAGTVDRDGG